MRAFLMQRLVAFSLTAFMFICSSLGITLADSYVPGELFEEIPVSEKAEGAIRILSFNIRFDDVNGVKRMFRRGLVVQTITDIDPDSFGVQEATPEWMRTLGNLLPDYKYVGLGRDGEEKGEYSAIFYNAKKYKMLNNGTFWLSDTPLIPSNTWDAAHYRICTWAVLQNKETEQIYVHVNAHYDHKSTAAKREAAKLVCENVESMFKDYPVFFTADMNADPYSQVYRTMTNTFKDARVEAPDTSDMVTFHNLFQDNKKIIDYCLYRGDVTPLTYRVVTKGVVNRYVSDHFPVYADYLF